MVDRYLEKVYAGFLGMNIGIRLGAPVEPTIWTYERIRDTYGDITGYVKEYKNFAADDDANGPVFFLRALYDDARDRPLTAQDVARAWLNYAREGVGLYWWGGYGVSTEHTAYLNLKNGIPAPQSGSVGNHFMQKDIHTGETGIISHQCNRLHNKIFIRRAVYATARYAEMIPIAIRYDDFQHITPWNRHHNRRYIVITV